METKFGYEVFDGDPAASGPCGWDAESRDDSPDASDYDDPALLADAVLSWAAGECDGNTDYSIGDKLYVLVNCSDGSDNKFYRTLDGDDLSHVPQLAADADTSHETAQDMYHSYGAHVDSLYHGSIGLQHVEYGWLDGYDDEVVDLLVSSDGWPDPIDDDDRDDLRSVAYALAKKARSVRGDMEVIEALLDDAVTAYLADDLAACVEALSDASDAENDHGDDPAASALASQLLTHGLVSP